jgi:hypothetical protein
MRQLVPPEKIAELYAEGIKLKAGATNADMVALSMGRQALRGNVTAAKELREAVEGKATQRIELSRSEDRAVEFVVLYATPIPGEKIEIVDERKVIDMEPMPEKPAEVEAPAAQGPHTNDDKPK